jgi:hypothetical protein
MDETPWQNSMAHFEQEVNRAIRKTLQVIDDAAAPDRALLLQILRNQGGGLRGSFGSVPRRPASCEARRRGAMSIESIPRDGWAEVAGGTRTHRRSRCSRGKATAPGKDITWPLPCYLPGRGTTGRAG